MKQQLDSVPEGISQNLEERLPTELHKYKVGGRGVRGHRLKKFLLRRWALQRPRRVGTIYKRKSTTSANNHYYLSSGRHARTLCCSKCSLTQMLHYNSLLITLTRKMSATLVKQSIGREKILWRASFCFCALYVNATVCGKNRHETCWVGVSGELFMARKRSAHSLQVYEGLSCRRGTRHIP